MVLQAEQDVLCALELSPGPCQGLHEVFRASQPAFVLHDRKDCGAQHSSSPCITTRPALSASAYAAKTASEGHASQGRASKIAASKLSVALVHMQVDHVYIDLNSLLHNAMRTSE